MAKRTSKQPGQTGKASLTRRSFLKRGTAATAAAVAFPYIIPAKALGLDGNVAPSNRIVMGCLGVGSQGSGNMRGFLGSSEVQIVAVCDVDAAHRQDAMNAVNEVNGNKDCAGLNDFRELIDRADLDALSIALPDHWHAIPVVAAASKGLDMYAEKPLALTISQGRAMVDAVERNGIVWQTGSWQRSKENFHRACELVRNGVLGDIHTVEVGLPTGSTIETQPEMPIPEGFDYNFWLGPAPKEPYTEKRCHWNFRWILDYSGGQLTDWAAHHCDIANWGMGTEHTGPISVEGKGDYPTDGLYNAATAYKFQAEYAPGASPVAPKGFTMWVMNDQQTGFGMGTKFIGDKGWLHVSRGDTLTIEPADLAKVEFGENDVRLPKIDNHQQNFLDCVRSRAKTIAPIAPAHHAIAIAHLGNIAMQLERKVEWDPEKERFKNDAEADRKLSRSMRGAWRL